MESRGARGTRCGAAAALAYPGPMSGWLTCVERVRRPHRRGPIVGVLVAGAMTIGGASACDCAADPTAGERARNEKEDDKQAAGRPNLLLIVIDTQRADHLEPYGAEIDTPNVAGLARSGVRFDAAYSQAPITAPSHASLFTSLLASDHGLTNNGDGLADRFTTLAEILSEHGWHTGAFVSLGVLAARKGFDQGFDVYRDRIRRGWWATGDEVTDKAMPWITERARAEEPFFAWVHYSDPHEPYRPPSRYPRMRLERGGETIARFEVDGRKTKIRVELPPGEHRLVLRREAGSPGSPSATGDSGQADGGTDGSSVAIALRYWKWPEDVEVSYDDTWGRASQGRKLSRGAPSAAFTVSHEGSAPRRIQTTFVPRCAQTKEQKRQGYVDEVEYVDRELGRVLDRIEDLGIRDRTFVILTSDHGEELGEHGRFGHVQNLYEPVIRVPLILSRPHESRAGSTIDEPVRLLDLLPTVLESFEIPVPGGIRGQSLLPLDHIGGRTVVSETFPPQAHARKTAVRFGRYKYVRNHTTGRERVYDVELDPNTPLSAKGRARMRQMIRNRPVEAAPQKPATALPKEEREALRALGYAE